MNTLIPEQSFIRVSVPNLSGSLDYKREVEIFKRIDHLLSEEGIEDQMKLIFIQHESKAQGVGFDRKEQLRLQRKFSQSLRVNITKNLLGCSFRELSARVSDSNLLQWFCQFDSPYSKKLPSKSKLNDLANCLPDSIIRGFHNVLMSSIHHGLDSTIEDIDLNTIYADSTCIKLNVHHPVDWVFLRDAIKSIMKTIKTIRKHGLKHRMAPPDGFTKKANQLSIEMSMSKSKRNQDSKNKRKDILRKLKSLMRNVEQHGRRYVQLLHNSWKRSDLSEKQAERLSMNLINILDQIDDIIFQAHERIIGERRVQNKDKVLSLYERHTQVYIRGKSGSEVEFGLQLFLAETEQGLLIDWDLRNGKPQGDSKFVRPCIERIKQSGIEPNEFVGDRGFVSKKTDNFLADNNIGNQIYPRNATKAKRKQVQVRFQKAANRRSQTEGRIGIIKNNFIGGCLRSKGFQNQSKQVAWAILSHNFWVLARMPMEIPDLKHVA